MDPGADSLQRPSVERRKATPRLSVERAEPFPVAIAASAPAHELIARRAYELFQQRGGDHGRDVEDWLEAERELVNPTLEAGLLTRTINEPPAN